MTVALWDVVGALQAKIRASADTASPEELAYLGTAIEKIAGPLSTLELANHVDTLKAQLDQYKLTASNSLTQLLNTKIADAERTLLALKDSYVGVVNNTITPAVSSVNTSVNNKVLEAQDAVAALQAAIQQASVVAQQISQQQPISEMELLFFNSF